jgi:hypothetical protein
MSRDTGNKPERTIAGPNRASGQGQSAGRSEDFNLSAMDRFECFCEPSDWKRKPGDFVEEQGLVMKVTGGRMNGFFDES